MLNVEFSQFATCFVNDARDLLRETLSSGLNTEAKLDKSLVTTADRAIENTFRERLSQQFPTHGVLGEEYGAFQPEAEHQWIIDPVDGTEELVHGIPLYGLMLSLYRGDTPLLSIIDHPELDVQLVAKKGEGVFRNGERLPGLESESKLSRGLERVGWCCLNHFWEKGVPIEEIVPLLKSYPNSRMYNCCFEYTAAFTGALDVVFNWGMLPWDVSVADLFVEELGGKLIEFKPTFDSQGVKRRSVLLGKKEVVKRFYDSLPSSIRELRA